MEDPVTIVTATGPSSKPSLSLAPLPWLTWSVPAAFPTVAAEVAVLVSSVAACGLGRGVQWEVTPAPREADPRILGVFFDVSTLDDDARERFVTDILAPQRVASLLWLWTRTRCLVRIVPRSGCGDTGASGAAGVSNAACTEDEASAGGAGEGDPRVVSLVVGRQRILEAPPLPLALPRFAPPPPRWNEDRTEVRRLLAATGGALTAAAAAATGGNLEALQPVISRALDTMAPFLVSGILWESDQPTLALRPHKHEMQAWAAFALVSPTRHIVQRELLAVMVPRERRVLAHMFDWVVATWPRGCVPLPARRWELLPLQLQQLVDQASTACDDILSTAAGAREIVDDLRASVAAAADAPLRPTDEPDALAAASPGAGAGDTRATNADASASGAQSDGGAAAGTDASATCSAAVSATCSATCSAKATDATNANGDTTADGAVDGAADAVAGSGGGGGSTSPE